MHVMAGREGWGAEATTIPGALRIQGCEPQPNLRSRQPRSRTTMNEGARNRPKSQALGDDNWLFALAPEDCAVPRYQDDVLEVNQPRAVKAHRRELGRARDESQPRHFWLPHSRKGSAEGIIDNGSDSEDGSPRRERIWSMRPMEGSDAEETDIADLTLVEQHQRLQEDHPENAPHTCAHCRKIAVDLRRQKAYCFVPADSKHPRGWRVHPSRTGFTITDARVAAADGCSFFDFVVASLQIRGSEAATDGGLEITMTGMVQSVATLGVSVQRNQGQGRVRQRNNPVQSLNLYTVPGTRPLHKTMGYYLPPNLLPDSELSFTRARRWLEDCDKNHPGCRAHAVARPCMPKRVLEIDLSSPTSRVKLTTNAPLEPYVALSYCWGGDQMAKTVDSRVAEYSKNIDVPTLPKTIQDAITVTHGIGLRYLWVDAMCIIQDDADDMIDQLSQMYAVYRSAYVTISAATASTSQEGFLHPRPLSSFLLNARLSSSTFGPLLAVPEPKAFFQQQQRQQQITTTTTTTATTTTTTTTNPKKPNFISSPLFTRGWTYQEHRLSPRIIIYPSAEALYWCGSSTHRDGGNESPHWQTNNQYAALLFYQAQLGGREETKIEHPKSWGDVIENYTGRNLTVETDKLPAVAAVAEHYASVAPVTRYFAGMWREELVLQSLWSVWDPTKTARPKGYRAPSWSWASLDGGIYPWTEPGAEGDSGKETKMEITCEVLHVETTLENEKLRFGSVTAGEMRVRGTMRKVLWFNYGEYQGGRYHALNRSHGRDPDVQGEELELLMQLGGMDPRVGVNVDVVGEWEDGKEVVLWSLEVYVSCGAEKGKVEGGEGILLQEVEGRGEDMLRRVGRISVQSVEYMKEAYWFNERETEWREVTII